MAKSVLCLVLTASTGSLTAAGVSEDAELLVQARLSTETDAATEETACRCLSWKDVFTSGNYHVRCGDGPAELAWTRHWEKLPPNNHYKEDFCNMFLHKLQPNACINFKYGTRSTDQWCFVDKSCNKATPLADNQVAKVGYRMCVAGKDTLLREQSPRKVWKLANESHVDPAMLIKWAYPITGALDGKVRWPGVKEAMGLSKPTKDSDAFETRRVLKQMKKSKQTMIFESDEKHDGQPPFGFIWGTSTWEVTRTPFLEANAKDARGRIDVQVHTDKISQFTCIEGC